MRARWLVAAMWVPAAVLAADFWTPPGAYEVRGGLSEPAVASGGTVLISSSGSSYAGSYVFDYLIAVEYQHIKLGHVNGGSTVISNGVQRQWLSGSEVLDADCAATRMLAGQGRRQAAEAAMGWFRGKGGSVYPPYGGRPGVERAARIQGCL